LDPSRADIGPLAAKHGIVLLLQFGSSVTGKVHARSDVDVAVLLQRVPATLAAHAELIADLQDLFPEREVDVALVTRAKATGSLTVHAHAGSVTSAHIAPHCAP